MKRYALNSLEQWKNSYNRKPLILWGARQVGKTWLMKEFGKKYFKQTIYLNFDLNPELSDYFQTNLEPQRIIKALEGYFGKTITSKDTLIIFDEIQECQRAKDSLKYFTELAPNYYIVSAGSFLGVSEGKFPVGKVDSLTLYPMSFYEFLEAMGKTQLLDTIINKDTKTLESLKSLLLDLLKTYFYVGGLPEVVSTFVNTKDLQEVRSLQNDIIKNYHSDFSKHIDKKNISKVRMLWDSVPTHLAREKKKFVYKDIKIGGRASEFEDALNWLVNTGLVYKVSRVLTPKLPLQRDSERENFKLFLLDIGLLTAMSGVDISTFYLPNNLIFNEFKGAITEQYVCQELKTSLNSPLFYWGREHANAELDFLIQYKTNIIPIEAKFQTNTKAKSLGVYTKEYNPTLTIKTSLNQFRFDPPLLSLPLYMIESIADIIDNLKI